MPHLFANGADHEDREKDFFTGNKHSTGGGPVVRLDAPPPRTSLIDDTNDLRRPSSSNLTTPNMNELRHDNFTEHHDAKRCKKDHVNTVTPMTARDEMGKEYSHGNPNAIFPTGACPQSENNQNFQHPTTPAALGDSSAAVSRGYNALQGMMMFPNPSENANTDASSHPRMCSQIRQHPILYHQQQPHIQSHYMPFPPTRSQVHVHPMMHPLWITTAAKTNPYVVAAPSSQRTSNSFSDVSNNFRMSFPVYMTPVSATQMNHARANIQVANSNSNMLQQYVNNNHNTHGHFEGGMISQTKQAVKEDHHDDSYPVDARGQERGQQDEPSNETFDSYANDKSISSVMQSTKWNRKDQFYNPENFDVIDDAEGDVQNQSNLLTRVHLFRSEEEKVASTDMGDSYDDNLVQLQEFPVDHSKPIRSKRISKHHGEQPRNKRTNVLKPSKPITKSPLDAVKERIQTQYSMSTSSHSKIKCSKLTAKELARYGKLNPQKLAAELEHTRSFDVPHFAQLLNYKSGRTEGTLRECGMCGELRPAIASKSPSSEGSDNYHIPSQNKGICNACDGAVWIIDKNLIEIKWCKGCKNFRKWIDFDSKFFATKCGHCREKQREKYKEKCDKREKQSLERALMYQKVKHNMERHNIDESYLNPLEYLLAAASTQMENERDSD